MTATTTMTRRIATGTAVAALSLGMVACSEPPATAPGTDATGRGVRDDLAQAQADD